MKRRCRRRRHIGANPNSGQQLHQIGPSRLLLLSSCGKPLGLLLGRLLSGRQNGFDGQNWPLASINQFVQSTATRTTSRESPPLSLSSIPSACAHSSLVGRNQLTERHRSSHKSTKQQQQQLDTIESITYAPRSKEARRHRDHHQRHEMGIKR